MQQVTLGTDPTAHAALSAPESAKGSSPHPRAAESSGAAGAAAASAIDTYDVDLPLPITKDPMFFNGTDHADWLIKAYGKLEGKDELSTITDSCKKLLVDLYIVIQKRPQKIDEMTKWFATIRASQQDFNQYSIMQAYFKFAALCDDGTAPSNRLIAHGLISKNCDNSYDIPEAYPFKYVPCFGDNSEFGIVTFIDLWLEGLWAVGFPHKNQLADDTMNSPFVFAAHDVQHLQNYKTNPDRLVYKSEPKVRFLIKALRDKIISHPTRSGMDKKIDMMILFYALHETAGVNQALHEVSEYTDPDEDKTKHFFNTIIRKVIFMTPYQPEEQVNLLRYKQLIKPLNALGCQVPELAIPEAISRQGTLTREEEKSQELHTYMRDFFTMMAARIEDFIKTYSPTIDDAFAAEAARIAEDAAQKKAEADAALDAFLASLDEGLDD